MTLTILEVFYFSIFRSICHFCWYLRCWLKIRLLNDWKSQFCFSFFPINWTIITEDPVFSLKKYHFSTHSQIHWKQIVREIPDKSIRPDDANTARKKSKWSTFCDLSYEKRCLKSNELRISNGKQWKLSISKVNIYSTKLMFQLTIPFPCYQSYLQLLKVSIQFNIF